MKEKREEERRKTILNNELLTKIKQNKLKFSVVDLKNQKITHQQKYAL
jgi:hypothetical protein